MQPTVAYLTMEAGLAHTIPTYSGGLGALAGDAIKSAADLGLPLVGVTLLYGSGYFKQDISRGGQDESYPAWDPGAVGLQKLNESVSIFIEDRKVQVSAWRYDVKGRGGHVVPVYFLDTDREGNAPWDRDITRQPLYTGQEYFRLAQEAVLGIGGVRMLQELGMDIKTYHLNEGHASLLSFELLRQRGSLDEAIERSVFTTHTPVPAGLQRFGYSLAQQVIGTHIPQNVEALAGESDLNMTLLALRSSRYANGVSRKHGEVSRDMFPQYRISHITNGVHSPTWTAPEFQELFDRYLPSWRTDPSVLDQIGSIDDAQITRAHQRVKERFVEYLKEQTGVEFDPQRPILGFARRAAGYKRQQLLFSDMERLTEIGRKHGLQIVYAGKAHPSDGEGKSSIARTLSNIAELNRQGINAAYVPNYGLADCAMLTAGSDVWLNTPIVSQEASGTSGMCAAHNGVPQFGTLDGWWLEGLQEGVTGWGIGGAVSDDRQDADDLYEKLEKTVLPGVGDPAIMKGAVSNAAFFNTDRMMRDYVKQAYEGKIAEEAA